MTEQSTTPKKKSIAKKVFIVIAFILALFGIEHYTYNIEGIGASVTVTDSTITVSPMADSLKKDSIAKVVAADTSKKVIAKKDTTIPLL